MDCMPLQITLGRSSSGGCAKAGGVEERSIGSWNVVAYVLEVKAHTQEVEAITDDSPIRMSRSRIESP